MSAMYDPLGILLDMGKALSAAGIDNTIDARDLNPPAVLIELESVAHNILSGAMTLRARLLCCVADTGPVQSLTDVSELYAAVTEVITPNTEIDTTYENVNLPEAGPVPALVMRVDVV